jgi:hypothetical protein
MGIAMALRLRPKIPPAEPLSAGILVDAADYAIAVATLARRPC